MANLLNALPQTNANAVSPRTANANPQDAKQLELDAKSMQAQFEKQLESVLNDGENSDQTNTTTPQDLLKKAALAQAQAQGANAQAAAQIQSSVAPLPNALANLPQAAGKLPDGTQNSNLNASLQAKTAAPKNQRVLPPSEFQVNPLKPKKDQLQAQQLGTGMTGAGANVNELMGLGEFQVEGLELESPQGNAELKNSVAESGKKVGTHSSNISTDSFLNLREISQSKNAQTGAQSGQQNPQQFLKPEAQQLGMQFGTAAGAIKATDGKKQKFDSQLAQLNPGSLAMMTPTLAKTIDAPVTQGSQQSLVLSHDALNQISTHLAQMKQGQQQNGEIKIRLRPDHLGELQMSVRTQGSQVSLAIKAVDEQSKKIIESSLNSLKDNLAQQNLTLGRVDVVTQPNSAQGMSSGSEFGMNLDTGAHGSQSQQSHSQNNERGWSERAPAEEANVPQRAQQFMRARPSTSQRLDMIA